MTATTTKDLKRKTDHSENNENDGDVSMCSDARSAKRVKIEAGLAGEKGEDAGDVVMVDETQVHETETIPDTNEPNTSTEPTPPMTRMEKIAAEQLDRLTYLQMAMRRVVRDNGLDAKRYRLVLAVVERDMEMLLINGP